MQIKNVHFNKSCLLNGFGEICRCIKWKLKLSKNRKQQLINVHMCKILNSTTRVQILIFN